MNRRRNVFGTIVRVVAVILVLLLLAGAIVVVFSTDWNGLTDTDEVSVDGEPEGETGDEPEDELEEESEEESEEEPEEEPEDEPEEEDPHSGYSILSSAGGTLTGGTSETEMVYYYLDDDVELTTDITISDYAMLCLNGNTLTGTGSGSVITVNSGATFVLDDCSEDENGVVTGGKVSKTVSGGGGVYVYSGGEFYLYGGAISGNAATVYGGGVYIAGTFYMYGGSITGNTLSTSGSSFAYGGGVYLTGTFYMFDGTISENIASSRQVASGGGVSISYGVFYMDGGSITGNELNSSVNSARGGGVYINYGEFYMSAGKISSNILTGSSTNGCSVYVHSGAFTLYGGYLYAGEADYGSCMYIYATSSISSSFNMTGGKLSGTLYVNSYAEVTISGGYLSTSAYNSILDSSGNVQYIASGKSVKYASAGYYLVY